MVIQSRWTTPIPEVSLQRWIFGSSRSALPNSLAFVDTDDPISRSLSLSDYRLWSKKVGRGLQKAGLQPGDRVLLFSGNNVFFPSVFMGTLMAGGIFTAASPAFTARELSYQLEDSGARFLIVAPELVGVAIASARNARLSESCVFVLSQPDRSTLLRLDGGIRHWTELLAAEAEADDFDWVEPIDPRTTTCCLNYSSGTTGRPKGVEISHYAYVANAEAAISQINQGRERTRHEDAGRALCFLPLYHAAAQTTFAVNFPKMGVAVFIMKAYSFDKMLQCIQRFRITDLFTAPPVLRTLALSPQSSKYNLDSVERIICGTAPLPPPIVQEVQKIWPAGKIVVQQAWGMTELTCVGSMVNPLEAQAAASVGEVVPNAAIKIIRDGKEVLQAGTHGEIWFTGPTLMKGYWRNPEATRETIVEEMGTRWLKTGDIGFVDAYRPGGRIYIVDRAKELIKVKGFQVAPAELEALLSERGDVLDAAVIGVLVNGLEVPRAYVVKSSASKATESEIARWLDERVAWYKRLAGGLRFVEGIPRNSSGKILRRVLKEQAEKEIRHKSHIGAKLA